MQGVMVNGAEERVRFALLMRSWNIVSDNATQERTSRATGNHLALCDS